MTSRRSSHTSDRRDAASTVNMYVGLCRALFRWAVKNKYPDPQPRRRQRAHQAREAGAAALAARARRRGPLTGKLTRAGGTDVAGRSRSAPAAAHHLRADDEAAGHVSVAPLQAQQLAEAYGLAGRSTM